MPFDCLANYVRSLEEAGELHRVAARVSPILEIAAIADKVSKAEAPSKSDVARGFDPCHFDRGGKALLFENVEGSDFPVAINLWGSYRRMELALGGDFDSIAARIASLTRPVPPRSFGEIVAKAREFMPLLRIGPRKARRAPCQQVVKRTEENAVDLGRLGIIKCWPLDGDPGSVGYPMSPEEAGTAAGMGRYITLAGMHTVHADDSGAAKPASHNIGMYRAQMVDATRLVMHWHMHHDGAAHWRSWKRAGKRMPIAICLGGESVLPYSATAPLPPGISELLMAGFLNGRGIPMTNAVTVPLRVPANSEIVIEGWVSTECGGIDWDPGSTDEPLGPGAAFEGPFGDHTGYYSLPDRYPIVEVTAITHRRDAIYPTTVVGPPPMEDYYIGKATERIFLPLLRTIVHDIDDYHLPMFGCFHNCAAIAIRKDYPLQGRRVMHSVWGAGQMAWTKMIIVVDDDIELHDEKVLLRTMLERCDFSRDIEIVHGPLDILDQAAPELGAGCKIGFDATTKISGDGVEGSSIEAPVVDDDATYATACGRVAELDGVRFSTPDWGARRLLVLGMPAETGPEQVESLVKSIWKAIGADSSCADLLLVVDDDIDLEDFDRVLFALGACCDPGRDLMTDKDTSGRRIAFNATTKAPDTRPGRAPVRRFAPYLAMDEATDSQVGSRWAEYGLDR